MRQHAVPVILIAIISGGVFVNALHSEFVWDDKPMIVDNAHIRDLRNAPRFFTPRYWQTLDAQPKAMRGRAYRPLVEVSFAVDYAIWRLNPVGWHITSVVWHAVNCVLVYFLALRILGSRLGAVFCALLFAAHPIHVEAVVWSKARSVLLSFMLMLASLFLYLRYMEASPRVGRTAWLYVGSIVAFVLAVTSRASAVVVMPPLLVLCLWCIVPRRRLRAGLLAVAPFVAILGTFFVFRSFTPTTFEQTWPMSPYEHLLTMISTTGVYLRLLLLPTGMCAHHPNPLPTSLWQPEVLIGLGLWLTLVAATVVACRYSRRAFFALAWLLICLAPISNVWLFTRLIGELRAYPASVGFCLLLGAILHGLPALRRASSAAPPFRAAAIALCAVVVAAYGALTWARNSDWRDNLTLWQDTVRKNPNSHEAHRNLAEIHMKRRETEQAIVHFRRTAELHSEYVWALWHLARLCAEAGRDEEAIGYYEGLLQFRPANVGARIALGTLYARHNRLVEAQDQFKAALHYDGKCAAACYNLGAAYLLQGRHEQAAVELRRALDLGSDDAATHHALGAAHAGMGRNEAALAEYGESLRLDPLRAQTWMAMGECHEDMGNAQQAVRCYKKCTGLGGPLAEAAQRRLDDLAPHAEHDRRGVTTTPDSSGDPKQP